MDLVTIRQAYKDSAWFSANAAIILPQGQVVHLLQTGTYKIGDGTSILSALTFLGGSGGGGAVSSVNTQTGAVVLTAGNVGADVSGAAANALTAANIYTDNSVDLYKDSAWFSANATRILKEGQKVYQLQTGLYKVGDGTSQLSTLSFLGGDLVTSVNTQTGAVVLTAANVGADASGSAAAALSSANSYTNSQGFITNVVTSLGYTPENVTNKKNTINNSSTEYPTSGAVLLALAANLEPRVQSVTSASTITPDIDLYDCVSVTALAAALTINWTGSAVNFQPFIIRIKDNGTARSLTFTSSLFEPKGTALPTTTVVSKVLTVAFLYDSVTGKFGCVGAQQEL